MSDMYSPDSLSAGAAGLRLWPLNPDRGIVAASLTRAALNLGHPSMAFHGIKPPVGRTITYLLQVRAGVRTIRAVRGPTHRTNPKP